MAKPKPRYGPCSDCGAVEGELCYSLKSPGAPPMKTVHKGRPKLPPPLRGKARAEALMARIAERDPNRAFLL